MALRNLMTNLYRRNWDLSRLTHVNLTCERHVITVDRKAVSKLFKTTGGTAADSPPGDDKRHVVSHKIAVNNVHLHYEVTGTGKNVILLLPGVMGSSQTDFKQQLEHFNKDMFTVIALDPRGYGRSIPPERDWPEHFFERDANDAAQLMQNLGVDQYSLLGWSDGGITALIVAARHSRHVRKLVVWGANCYVTDGELEIYDKIRDISKWNESARKAYLTVYSQEYLQHHFSQWVDALKLYKTKRDGDICRAEVANILSPTLILHGEKDPMVPRFHAEYLVKNIKNVSLYSFGDGRHNIHQQHYKLFNSVVEHFLIQPVDA